VNRGPRQANYKIRFLKTRRSHSPAATNGTCWITGLASKTWC
jgi:hypothetical protein